MSAKHAMSVAQRLYEKGFITYMRTDSTALSTQAVQAAREQAVALYGEKAVPLNPRVYANKSKNAQEAHEAIRPSGETFRTPAEVSGELDRDEQRLYDLIWKRTMASQMSDAKYETTTVTLEVAADGRKAEFTASGTVYTFRGFLDAYEESHDEKRSDADKADDQSLPALAVGDVLRLKDVEPKGHATSPKPRFTEASLVKALEEKGIGRPSTFASIIDVIINRGYVTKRGQALIPSWLAFSVVRLLEEHFADLVDYDFTAALEDDLDAIARGEQKREDWLKDFYFGSDDQVGLRNIVDNLGEIDARALNSTPIGDVATLRFGKYGPYLEIPDPENAEADPRRVNIPEDLAPDELTPAKAQELIDAPVAGDRVLGENPENGKLVVVKDGRFGPYVQEIDPPAADEVDEETGEIIEPEAPPSRRRRSARRRRRSRRSRAPPHSSSRCPSTRSTSRPQCACSTCRARSVTIPRRGCPSRRRTADTVRTSRRGQTRGRSRPSSSSSTSRSRRRSRSTRSRSTALVARRARSRSSRPTPSAASRSSSRTAGSARM